MLKKKRTKAALAMVLTAVMALYMPMAAFAEESFDESYKIQTMIKP